MSQEGIKDHISLEIIKDRLHDMESDIKDTNKGLRLTNIQKENIEISFEVFVKTLQNLEQQSFKEYDDLYVFSDEYQLTAVIKDFMYKKPFSVFACFKCKKLVKFQNNGDLFTKVDKKTYHICSEGLIGEGVQTNWKSLYYLFYNDMKIRKYLIEYFISKQKENV